MRNPWRAVARAIVLAVLLTLAAAGCGGPQAAQTPAADQTPSPAPEPLPVTVSILPEKYFVERVGGEHVTVNVLVGPGDEPHSYEPVAEQLRALSAARVYFTIGVEFEAAWLGRFRAANPALEIVDLRAGLDLLPATDGAGETDPHVWTSPRRAARMAATIADTLSRLDPAHEADYRANLAAFTADVDALDAEIRSILAAAPGRKFVVFHPAWGYFAADYGLQEVVIEVGGQEPSAAELAAVVREAQQEGIRVVFAQPNLSTRSAEAIAAEIGGQVVLIDPLAEDWLDNMYRVARALAAGLAG